MTQREIMRDLNKIHLLIITLILLFATPTNGRMRGKSHKRSRNQRKRPRKPKEPNCYEKFGISTDATERQVKKAFRKLSLKYHPDKVKEEDREKSEEKFKELAACYQILSDQDQRKKYDASGYNEQFDSNGAQYSNFDGQGFEDIFSSFFGAGNEFGFDDMFGDDMFNFNVGGNDFGQRRRQRQPQRQRQRESKKKNEEQKIFVDLQNLMTDHFVDIDGVQLEIPKGCPNGKIIKERGRKYAIYSRKHDNFERKRSDLYTNITISLEEALLGFDLKVQSIDGEMIEERMDHLPVTKMLKIKSKGLPRFGGKTRGHLFVEINVEMPLLTKEQQSDLNEYLNKHEWDYTAAKRETNKRNKKKKRRNERKTEL